MIFEESDNIDMPWGNMICHLCVERQKGSAKGFYVDEKESNISVYADDYTDLAEVNGLLVRIALKAIGVKRQIGFKPDTYTLLDIDKEDTWKYQTFSLSMMNPPDIHQVSKLLDSNPFN